MSAIGSALTWIATFLSGRAVAKTAEFIAFKGLYILLLVTVLPFALVKLGTYLSGKIFDYIGAETSFMSPVVFDATGMLAWLLNCFQVPYCATVILSAYVARYSIKSFKLLLTWR